MISGTTAIASAQTTNKSTLEIVNNPRDTQIFQVFNGVIRPEYLRTVRENGLNTNCSYILTDPGSLFCN